MLREEVGAGALFQFTTGVDAEFRPEVLGGLTEVSARRGKPKSTVVTWWARSNAGKTLRLFPEPLFTISTGPVWFPPDIDGYTPGDGRWPDRAPAAS